MHREQEEWGETARTEVLHQIVPGDEIRAVGEETHVWHPAPFFVEVQITANHHMSGGGGAVTNADEMGSKTRSLNPNKSPTPSLVGGGGLSQTTPGAISKVARLGKKCSRSEFSPSWIHIQKKDQTRSNRHFRHKQGHFPGRGRVLANRRGQTVRGRRGGNNMRG